jgi:hypothetical protein
MKLNLKVSLGLAAIAFGSLTVLNATVFAASEASQPQLLAVQSDSKQGFRDGVNAARTGGDSSPTYDTSEAYRRAYEDGFAQYSSGFRAGVQAVSDGDAPSPTYDASETYQRAYEDGFASVVGQPGMACLMEADRRDLRRAAIGADYSGTGGVIEIDTANRVFSCRVNQGKVVGFALRR